MATVIDTIDAYIAAQPQEHQQKLKELREFILNNAPEETSEAISYAMPTFRYHGNLIHFCLFKNHIGIYPGAAAIQAHKDLLQDFKFTKGAIQIPLNDPIPNKLIKTLISFNVETLKDKKGPQWHKAQGNWDEAYEIMEAIILKFPELNKTHKWGSNVYTYKQKNVIAWGGFKDFFSLWFYNGVFLKDKANVLITASEGKTKSLRQWRFKQVKDMNESLIISYIKEAITTIDEGKEIKTSAPQALQPTELLANVLQNNQELLSAFNALTQGKKNEYINYIKEAKQEQTQWKRIEKITPLIMLGKGLNDKYNR